jgi:hypothetical protein
VRMQHHFFSFNSDNTPYLTTSSITVDTDPSRTVAHQPVDASPPDVSVRSVADPISFALNEHEAIGSSLALIDPSTSLLEPKSEESRTLSNRDDRSRNEESTDVLTANCSEVNSAGFEGSVGATWSSGIAHAKPPSSKEFNGNVKKSDDGILYSQTNSQSAKNQSGRSSASRFRNDELVLERVRDFCDETKYPIGSLIPKQNYVKVKTLFHTIIMKANSLVHEKYSRNVTPSGNFANTGSASDTINAALQLLVRICREPWTGPQNMVNGESASDSTQQSCARFCKPRYTNLLFNTWKNASLRNEKVLSAIDVTHLLQKISSNSHLRYDFVTIGMVLQVALHQSPKNLAPSVVQHIWESLEQSEMSSTISSSQSSTKRVLYFYNTLLKAYAESGSDVDDVLRYMYDVLGDMRDRRNLTPDVVSYNILLRFIGRNCPQLEKFEFAFQMMLLNKVQPDLATLFEAVYCYTKFEQVSRSEDFLYQMRVVLAAASSSDALKSHRKYQSYVSLVAHAAKSVMNLYLTLFRKYKTAAGRQEMVNRAHALFWDLNQQNIVSGASSRTFFLNRVTFRKF